MLMEVSEKLKGLEQEVVVVEIHGA